MAESFLDIFACVQVSGLRGYRLNSETYYFFRIKVSADPAGLFQQPVTLNLELSSIPVTETGSLNNSLSTVLKTLIIMGKLKMLIFLNK